MGGVGREDIALYDHVSGTEIKLNLLKNLKRKKEKGKKKKEKRKKKRKGRKQGRKEGKEKESPPQDKYISVFQEIVPRNCSKKLFQEMSLFVIIICSDSNN